MSESSKMKRKRSMKLAEKMAEQDQVIRESLTLVEEKLLIMSGKGGVDKTTVAINLAVGLSRTGSKVGLMDVDLHGPDIPRMLVLQGEGESYED